MTRWEKTQLYLILPLIIAVFGYMEALHWLDRKCWPERIYIRYTGIEHHGTRDGLLPDVILWLRENRIPYKVEQGDICFRKAKHAVWFKMRWM